MLNKVLQKSVLGLGLGVAMTAMADDVVSEKTADGVSSSNVATVATDDSSRPIKTRAEGEVLFHDCAAVVNDAARLACFDSLAQGKLPSVLQKKQAIVLGETVKGVVKGNRQVIFAKNETAYNAVNDGVEMNDKTIERYTPLSISYDLDKNSEQGLWRVRPHNPVYILPMYLHGKPNRSPGTPTQEAWHYTSNDQRAPELKYQISVKSKMAEDVFGSNADLWFGYTHLAHWQIYNEDNSRPFRAHDYEPEIFLTQPVVADLPFGGRLRMLGVGAVHHSNGEDNPWSRSWNRGYVMAGMEWGKLTVMPRLWGRILKEGGSKPDDNPDILDYYGYGDVKFLYHLNNDKNISGTARFNPKTGKGALQLDYVHPIGKGISGYVQLFQGYGQSLIDYNHEATSIGVGVMLNDWMGL
ncbi:MULTISPECIES: phospholipase A [unclassified Moraxella]|uniref:phospholipase A n=1 Tax=unclassified Moraxella TaxID=2685852 RepID=UPI00359D7208